MLALPFLGIVSIFMGSLVITMKFLLVVFVLSLHKDEVLGVC